MMWRIFIFALTTFVVVSAHRNPLERVKRSVDHVQHLVLNQRLSLPSIHQNNQIRHKRQIDDDDIELAESSLCLLTCANRLQRAALQYKNIDEQSGASPSDGANRFLKPTFNLTRLTNVCQSMRPPVECFERCPDSTSKTQIRASLEPIRFICIDRYEDFMTNLRCMHKLDSTNTRQCNPRCRRFESAVNRTMQLGRRPYLRHFYSVDELKEMLSGTCQFVQCYMDCSVPLTREVCGNTAADLSTGLIQKMFASVQNYDQLSNTNGNTVLPEACRRLARASSIDETAIEADGEIETDQRSDQSIRNGQSIIDYGQNQEDIED